MPSKLFAARRPASNYRVSLLGKVAGAATSHGRVHPAARRRPWWCSRALSLPGVCLCMQVVCVLDNAVYIIKRLPQVCDVEPGLAQYLPSCLCLAVIALCMWQQAASYVFMACVHEWKVTWFNCQVCVASTGPPRVTPARHASCTSTGLLWMESSGGVDRLLFLDLVCWTILCAKRACGFSSLPCVTSRAHHGRKLHC